MPNMGLEIIFGNIATLVVGILTVIFERGFETINYNKTLKVVILAMTAISVIVFTLLTFNLPWADVFTEPDWKEISLLLWRFHV